MSRSLSLWSLLFYVTLGKAQACESFNLVKNNEKVDIAVTCKEVPCLVKCCPESQIFYVNDTNVYCTSTSILENTYNVTNLEDYSELKIYNADIKREIVKTTKNISNFTIIYRDKLTMCDFGSQMIFYPQYVSENGTLEVLSEPVESIRMGDFCFENAYDGTNSTIQFYKNINMDSSDQGREMRAEIIANYGYQFRFDYSYYQELDGWLKLHENAVKWPEARLRCMREGAVLASPENEKLQAAMKRLMGQKTYIYTGIHSTDSIGYFYSVEGKPVSRMPVTWLANEPITSKGEACTYMTAEGISAYNCSVSLSFICYKKRNPGEKLTDCGTFDLDYTMDERTGKCYKFHTEPQKWANAFATCSGEGGHLAIINSDTEAQVLKELYAKHPPNSMPGKFDKHIVHMGFRDWGDHGLWRTIHGQSLKEAGYDKWAPSQPDNLGGGQFCGGIFQSGELDDLWCEGTYPFICEKDPDSLLDDQYEELVKAKYPWEVENPL